MTLLGAIIFLFEMPVLIAFYREAPLPGSTLAELAEYYAAHEAALGAGITILLLTIFGRLVHGAGLKSALRNIGEDHGLLDLAFGSLIGAVTLETMASSFGRAALQMTTYEPESPLATAAALQASASAFMGGVVILNSLWVALASWAVLRSGVFPKWMGRVGLVAGILYLLTVYPPAFGFYEPIRLAVDIVQVGSWLGMVVWMVATGIFLFRREPKPQPTLEIAEAAAFGG